MTGVADRQWTIVARDVIQPLAHAALYVNIPPSLLLPPALDVIDCGWSKIEPRSFLFSSLFTFLMTNFSQVASLSSRLAFTTHRSLLSTIATSVPLHYLRPTLGSTESKDGENSVDDSTV